MVMRLSFFGMITALQKSQKELNRWNPIGRQKESMVINTTEKNLPMEGQVDKMKSTCITGNEKSETK